MYITDNLLKSIEKLANNSIELSYSQQLFVNKLTKKINNKIFEISDNDIQEITKDLEKEITYARSLWPWGKAYKLALQTILNNILNNESLKKYAEKADKLYSKTQLYYNGILMLPIQQSFDKNTEEGKCHGYVTDWAEKILQNKKPFGVDPQGDPLFKPIPLNSPYKRHDLNNCAPTTNAILIKHQLQKTVSNEFQLLDIMSNNGKNITLKRDYLFDPIDLTRIAADLIKMLNKTKENRVYEIILKKNGTWSNGHVVGLYKTPNDEYHFMDPNYGWFKFKNSKDFAKWLPFFFKETGYEYAYHDYTAIYYSLGQKNLLADLYNSFSTYFVHEIKETALNPIKRIWLFFDSLSSTTPQDAHDLKNQNNNKDIVEQINLKRRLSCFNESPIEPQEIVEVERPRGKSI